MQWGTGNIGKGFASSSHFYSKPKTALYKALIFLKKLKIMNIRGK